MLTITVAQTFDDGFCPLIKNTNRSIITSTDDPPSLQSGCYMKGHIQADSMFEGLLLVQGGRYCGYFVAINAVNKVRNQDRSLIHRKGRVSAAGVLIYYQVCNFQMTYILVGICVDHFFLKGATS